LAASNLEICTGFHVIDLSCSCFAAAAQPSRSPAGYAPIHAISIKEDGMMRSGPILAALGLCIVVVACETPQQRIASKENLLVAAGFKLRPINTPQRQAALKQLPPHKFSRKVNDGRVFYVYPDPTVCGCLYVGDQTAYAAYRNNVFKKNLADEQAMTANEMSMDNWDWGPWGGAPLGWYY
jgi:hypothetical protein